MLVSICEFSENVPKEGYSILTGFCIADCAIKPRDILRLQNAL
jgi:hypothetical protein